MADADSGVDSTTGSWSSEAQFLSSGMSDVATSPGTSPRSSMAWKLQERENGENLCEKLVSPRPITRRNGQRIRQLQKEATDVLVADQAGEARITASLDLARRWEEMYLDGPERKRRRKENFPTQPKARSMVRPGSGLGNGLVSPSSPSRPIRRTSRLSFDSKMSGETHSLSPNSFLSGMANTKTKKVFTANKSIQYTSRPSYTTESESDASFEPSTSEGLACDNPK